MKKIVIALGLFLAVSVYAQNPIPVGGYQSDGSGGWTPLLSSASSNPLSFSPPPEALYCFNLGLGQWVPADSTCFSGASPGSVTSFSAGNLSPLFTTSVATPTTTPALTFSLTNAAANTAFGNFTVGSAAPSYTATNGTGAPAATTSPVFVTPTLGVASATDVTITGNGAASTSPLLATGTIETGGSGTTNFPHFFLQPTGTTAATTWSTNGTGLGMNLASGFTGNFLDFHVTGGASLFSVNQNGAVSTANAYLTSRGDTNWFAGAAGTYEFCNASFANCLLYAPTSKLLTVATINVSLWQTLANCAAVGTSASPSVASCAGATAGAFSCATTASAATCTITDTAVTANSEINVWEVADEGTRLSVTCNTAPTVPPAIILASKTAGTGFTINLPTIVTNPACYNFTIIN